MLSKSVLFGPLPATAIVTALVLLPLEVVTEAQQQAPAGPAPAATGRAGGGGLGGGRGGGPTLKPSALRAIPAETTAAKAKDPNWKAPRTAWGHPDLDGIWTKLFEYSCHEGNGAVGYALSGERAYEKMVADATAKGLPIPPRSMGMEVYSSGQVEGRQPVRELGGAK
jgi:hypothetical protein